MYYHFYKLLTGGHKMSNTQINQINETNHMKPNIHSLINEYDRYRALQEQLKENQDRLQEFIDECNTYLYADTEFSYYSRQGKQPITLKIKTLEILLLLHTPPPADQEHWRITDLAKAAHVTHPAICQSSNELMLMGLLETGKMHDAGKVLECTPLGEKVFAEVKNRLQKRNN